MVFEEEEEEVVARIFEGGAGIGGIRGGGEIFCGGGGGGVWWMEVQLLGEAAEEASHSSSSSDDSTSTSESSPIPQVVVGEKVVSKSTPNNDDVRVSPAIKDLFLFTYSDSVTPQLHKDKMPQSSENQMDHHMLLPRTDPNHTETSRAGEASLMSVTEPTVREPTIHAAPVPTTQAPAAQVVQRPVQSTTPVAAERAEASYQGIMASLPTFLKKSLPSQITMD
ncbi:hypothetical protein LIER_38288 [Lithospermum erythrorhizon]|uniref:Uncharacterized protein n=1 Tax=Lithospermum erythrorhizon TaxID=34254 RepID=A0AAV3PZ20_LITER